MKLLLMLTLLLFPAALFAALGDAPHFRGDLRCEHGPDEILDATFIRHHGPILESLKTEPSIVNQQEAAIYGEDNRVKANMNIFPYRTMGKLFIHFDMSDEMKAAIPPDKRQLMEELEQKLTSDNCTMTLVGQCHVITSRHCLSDFCQAGFFDRTKCKKKRFSVAELMSRGADQRMTEEQKNMLLQGSAAHPEAFKFTARFSFRDSLGRSHDVTDIALGPNNYEGDYAFIKIKGQPGKDLGHMGVIRKSPGDFAEGQKLSFAGYSADLNNGADLLVDHNAVVVRTARGAKTRHNKTGAAKKAYLTTRQDSYLMASGGALMAYDDEGTPYIAGINSTAVVRDDGGQTFLSDDENVKLAGAIVSGVFMDEMRSFIRSHRCQ